MLFASVVIYDNFNGFSANPGGFFKTRTKPKKILLLWTESPTDIPTQMGRAWGQTLNYNILML